MPEVVRPPDLLPLLLPVPAQLECLESAPVPVPTPLTVSGAPAELLDQTIGTVVRWLPSGSTRDTWLACQVDPAVGVAESYVLTVLNRSGHQPQAQLNAADEAGLRYGLFTLAQLLRQYERHMPALRIADRPRFAHRGIMLDISRDRVPTMAELFRLVELFASLKINHLQLYTEHTFAYAGHETVWQHASSLDAREITDLDRHCARYGIRLVANQNCFGHMERWLKHPAYRHLAEAETWTAFGQQRDYPFTLYPGDPASLALVDDLLTQILPHFRTKMVNIGCDETFDLGQGRSRAACDAIGKAGVYLDFVNQVCAIARREGYRPLLWADIALEHPEHLHELPGDIVALVWNYEADAPFARWCERIRAAGREVWVCPGTSSWCSLVGRSDVRHANLHAAADQGADHGATGYLITDWGDLGHRQQWPVSAIGLAEGALRAWSPAGAAWDARTGSLHVLGDASLTVGPWLDQLGVVDRDLRLLAGRTGVDGSQQPLMNRSALFHDLHLPWRQEWVGDVEQWSEISTRLAAMPPPDPLLTGMDAMIGKECRHTWRIAELAATRAVCRRRPDAQQALPILANTLETLIDEHRELWRQRSRPGGLNDSCAHYQRVVDDLRSRS